MNMDKTALYRFFDADGRLLYLGITQDIETRWEQHRRNQPWWLEVARKEFEWLGDRLDAERIEREALARERPIYDKVTPLPGGPRKRGPMGSFDRHADPRTESAAQQAMAHLQADMESGRFPERSFLPSQDRLSEQYSLPIIGISWAQKRLEARAGTLVRMGNRYLVVGKGAFPRSAPAKYGPVYVLASMYFEDERFSAQELADRTEYSKPSVAQQMKRLCEQRLARVAAQEGVGRWKVHRYQIIEHPEPEPAPVSRAYPGEDLMREDLARHSSQSTAKELIGSAFALTVRFILRDAAAAAAFDELVDQLMDGIRTEPGTWIYNTWTPEGEPLVRMFYEVYADRDSFAAHQAQPHTQRFLAEREQYLERFEVTYLNTDRTPKG